MSRRTFGMMAAGIILVAACSSVGGSPADRPPSAAPTGMPTAVVSVGPSAVASAAPSAASAASSATSATPVCTRTTEAGTVAVTIKDFEFAPATIDASAGQVITFTNEGFEHHNATLDAGGCATLTLQTGERDALAFARAGSYPFHCAVHGWMTGTIRIAA